MCELKNMTREVPKLTHHVFYMVRQVKNIM